MAKGGAPLGFADYLNLTITERKVLLSIHEDMLDREAKAMEKST